MPSRECEATRINHRGVMQVLHGRMEEQGGLMTWRSRAGGSASGGIGRSEECSRNRQEEYGIWEYGTSHPSR